MKFCTKSLSAMLIGAALIWLGCGAGEPVVAQQAGVTLTFTNIIETVKTKIKIDRSTMETNTTSTYTVQGSVLIENTSTSNAPSFWALLWIEQPTNFVTFPEGVPIGVPRKEKALKAGQSTRVPVKYTFKTDQAGTYFFLTSTNEDDSEVIAWVKIPPATE